MRFMFLTRLSVRSATLKPMAQLVYPFSLMTSYALRQKFQQLHKTLHKTHTHQGNRTFVETTSIKASFAIDAINHHFEVHSSTTLTRKREAHLSTTALCVSFQFSLSTSVPMSGFSFCRFTPATLAPLHTGTGGGRGGLSAIAQTHLPIKQTSAPC